MPKLPGFYRINDDPIPVDLDDADRLAQRDQVARGYHIDDLAVDLGAAGWVQLGDDTTDGADADRTAADDLSAADRYGVNYSFSR